MNPISVQGVAALNAAQLVADCKMAKTTAEWNETNTIDEHIYSQKVLASIKCTLNEIMQACGVIRDASERFVFLERKWAFAVEPAQQKCRDNELNSVALKIGRRENEIITLLDELDQLFEELDDYVKQHKYPVSAQQQREILEKEHAMKSPEEAQIYVQMVGRRDRLREATAEFERVAAEQRAEREVEHEAGGDGLSKTEPVASDAAAPAAAVGQEATLDDSTPKVTSKVGVHLAEQQQTVVRKAVDGNVRTSISRAQAHLNESDWDLDAMLKRFNLVSAFQWSLTDAVLTELPIVGTTPCDVPADLLQNNLVMTPFLRFQWWRCKSITVRFQLVASRFHQGRLGVYFYPSMVPKGNVTFGYLGPTRWTQLQHAFLDPANGTVIDFEIPFRFHKGWIDLVFGDSLGQIHVQVLNQLQAATGASTSVEVKVFVSFNESHFRTPRPGGDSFKSVMEREAKKMGYTLVKTVKEVGGFEGIGASVGKELDSLVEDILPAEVTGAIAGIALDKPAVTEYPPPLVHKDAQYMSANRGIENLERMTLEPSAQYITADQFGDSMDEMDMTYLLKKRVYLTRFNWAATQTVGTVLWSNINSPSHYMGATVGSFDPTIIGALADLFTYWRGRIVLIFQVVGTAFHEGRLDFCNHPAVTTPPTDYAAALSQYVNSQTIRNTNNTVEVAIPFHSDTPWKRCWNGENLVDTISDSGIRSMDYVTGCVSVRVSVPLKNPNNVANNVDVNVFVACGDDFEFHTMSIWGGRYKVANPGRGLVTKARAKQDREKKSKKVLMAQAVEHEAGQKTDGKSAAKGETKVSGVATGSGDLNTDTKDDVGIIPLGVDECYTYDPPVHHFGENYKSLRELCKRYQTSLFNQHSLTTQDTGGSFLLDPASTTGLIGHLANWYRLFRGPMNFKIQMNTQSVSGGNRYMSTCTGFCTTNVQPPAFSSSDLTTLKGYMGFGNSHYPQNVPKVRFSDTQVGEFQIPFQSIYHSLLIYQGTDNIPEYYANEFAQYEIDYNISQMFGTDTTKQAWVTLCYAFGDETRYGVFLGVPQYELNTVHYPNPGS